VYKLFIYGTFRFSWRAMKTLAPMNQYDCDLEC
jgi:hypothetical protein